MDKPKISWHVLEEMEDNDFEYIQCKTYNEEGSYIPGERIKKTIRVWNNYSGNHNVEDANNAKLIIAFKNFEDSVLLNLVTVQIDEYEEVNVEIDMDRGVIDLGSLSGTANNGSTLNGSNYKTIHITLGPIPKNIKSELKSMYFYLEYDSESE